MFYRSPTVAQNIVVYRSECYSFVKISMVKRDSICYRPRALHAFIPICTLLLHDSFLALYDAFQKFNPSRSTKITRLALAPLVDRSGPWLPTGT